MKQIIFESEKLKKVSKIHIQKKIKKKFYTYI